MSLVLWNEWRGLPISYQRIRIFRGLEYFFGQETQDHNFVERDRLQSGLACTVVLIQSNIKGGSMHTINFAKKQNRNIYAMKPLDDQNFLGNKKIIDEGLANKFSNYSELKIINQ